MPRIRTIKPKFWDDIKLSKISRDARLLFIGIWNFSDDLGVIVAEPVWIKSKVFPYDKLEPNQFEEWLEELISKKFIIPITYHDELFFYIRTFSTHQQINKPNRTEICIDIETLTKLKEQSRSNHGLITEQNVNGTVSIQGGIVKDSNSSSNSKGTGTEIFDDDFVPNLNFPIPKMQQIWIRYKPDYSHDVKRDFTPLQNIWTFISKQDKVKKDKRPEEEKILEAFEFISKYVATHDFFKTYSLKQIDTHIQSIIQNIQQNGTSKSKQATGKDVNVQSAFDAIDRHYAKTGKD